MTCQPIPRIAQKRVISLTAIVIFIDALGNLFSMTRVKTHSLDFHGEVSKTATTFGCKNNILSAAMATSRKGIAPGKRAYPHNIFLISPQKHMLWYSLEAPC